MPAINIGPEDWKATLSNLAEENTNLKLVNAALVRRVAELEKEGEDLPESGESPTGNEA
tara:strand:- start:33 stop:209 length:177 start_codon:yes stop_codon:yes gene_type:complete